MFKPLLFLNIVVLSLVSGCKTPEQESSVGRSANELEKSLNQVFELGREVPGGTDPILSSVGALVAASLNEIYHYDDRASLLHTYDMNGRYVETIAGPGSAPGEFRSAMFLTPFADGRIVLYDYTQHRLSIWAPIEKIFKVVALQSQVQFGAVATIEDGLIVLDINPRSEENVHTDILQIRETENGEITQAFGSLGELTTDTSPVAPFVYRNGNLLALGNDSILFAPGAYDGKVFLYQRSKGDWRLD